MWVLHHLHRTVITARGRESRGCGTVASWRHPVVILFSWYTWVREDVGFGQMMICLDFLRSSYQHQRLVQMKTIQKHGVWPVITVNTVSSPSVYFFSIFDLFDLSPPA